MKVFALLALATLIFTCELVLASETMSIFRLERGRKPSSQAVAEIPWNEKASLALDKYRQLADRDFRTRHLYRGCYLLVTKSYQEYALQARTEADRKPAAATKKSNLKEPTTFCYDSNRDILIPGNLAGWVEQ